MVRLTAEDGYSASRSYSVSSPPEDTGVVELTVDRLPDGEVSPYLTEVLDVGDEVESAARSAATSSGAARARCCWWPAGPGWRR